MIIFEVYVWMCGWQGLKGIDSRHNEYVLLLRMSLNRSESPGNQLLLLLFQVMHCLNNRKITTSSYIRQSYISMNQKLKLDNSVNQRIISSLLEIGEMVISAFIVLVYEGQKEYVHVYILVELL